VLLDPPQPLWRQVFGEDPPALTSLGCSAEELELRLRSQAERHLCEGALIEKALTGAEWQAVQAGRSAYDSPLACIERATDASAIPSG
jgi:hypothetical protein